MYEIEPTFFDELIATALQEDLGAGDITTRAIVSSKLMGSGEFVAKEELISGRVADCDANVSKAVSLYLHAMFLHRGRRCFLRQHLGDGEGPAAALLSGERVALNFLQRLSGVATLTRKFVSALSGLKAVILDTRKTTPGLRLLEKYAVRVGGGMNHRLGLADGVLIKENHITAAGSLPEAVRRAKLGADHLKKIEVEVTTLDELGQALKAGADVILLDNMNVNEIKRAVAVVDGKVPLEISGGVTLVTFANWRRLAWIISPWGP